MEKFEFDEENHIYKLNGSIIPSVSEIIELIHKRIYEDISFNTLKSAVGYIKLGMLHQKDGIGETVRFLKIAEGFL